jgi:type I restriction enzyme M protein
MKFEDLKDFIKCYNPENRYARKETWSKDNPNGRWRKFTYEEIVSRDKTNLDIFWVKDESLADLEGFREIVGTINGE